MRHLDQRQRPFSDRLSEQVRDAVFSNNVVGLGSRSEQMPRGEGAGRTRLHIMIALRDQGCSAGRIRPSFRTTLPDELSRLEVTQRRGSGRPLQQTLLQTENASHARNPGRE